MSTAKDRLKEAKEYLEQFCGSLVGPAEDTEQYNRCMAVWCLADALLQMQNDIESIKADVREVRDRRD